MPDHDRIPPAFVWQENIVKVVHLHRPVLLHS